MLTQAIKIVLADSESFVQGLLNESESRLYTGMVKQIIEEQVERSQQAHALLKDYIKRMEEK